MTKWVTIQEASVILGMSERTVWRKVANGSIEAKSEGKKKYVKIVTGDDSNDAVVMTMADKDGIIKYLKNELEERNKQIENLQTELKNSRERSDSIIMKLAEELEFQRQICQGIKPERKRDKSFWRLLGKSGNDTEL
jgi:5-bromo-4-chloroindolyl phosphate hydrolysis protein